MSPGLKIREWLETFGVIAVFASLVFVGLELRQSSEIATDASLSTSADITASIEELVLDHPDVWLRGCRGETLEATEKLIFTHLFQVYAFQYFMMYMRSDMVVAKSSKDISVDNIAINIHRNPGFARAWDDLAIWRSYAAEAEGNDFRSWRHRVDERLAYWERAEPEPLEMPERCGLL